METVYGIFLLLGGIGLFLYGINFMSAGLKQAAGDNLRIFLNKTTGKGPLGFLSGVLLTALIQSSGATSVMAAGFVGANMMTVRQALFVMLGANIGTTITAQIIAFKIDAIAPIILFIGVVLYMFIKKKTAKKIGAIVLGFGILFVGIYLMGEAIDMLDLSTLVGSVLQKYNNPVLMLVIGILITAVIQSSSASIGILQVLAAAGASTTVTLSSVFYLILGMNIGACSPVVINSFSSNRRCKASALSCVFAKIFGVFIFALLCLVFPYITRFVEQLSPGDVSRQIANLHLVFNIVASFALLPFVNWISRLSEKILPDRAAESDIAHELLYITPESLKDAGIAVLQAKRELMRMGKLACDNLELSLRCFFERDEETLEKVYETEGTVDYLNHEITSWLVKFNGQGFPDKEIKTISAMFKVVSDIERIGDHAENIAEYTALEIKQNARFSPDAEAELVQLAQHSLDVCREAMRIYDTEAEQDLQSVSDMEEEVDRLQELAVENHLERLKLNECDPTGGVIFTDMAIDLERCSDHAINIAFSIVDEKQKSIVKP